MLINFLSIRRRIESYEHYFSSAKCHLTSFHSSVFYHKDDPGTKWTLQIFPKGDKDACANGSVGSEVLSFFLNLDKNSDVVELPAKYSVAIIGNEGLLFRFENALIRFIAITTGDDRCVQKVSGDNTFKRGSGWGRSKFMKIEELMRDKAIFLVGDALTIRCTVQYTKHETKQEFTKKRRSSSVSTEPAKILNTDNISPESPGSPQSLIQPFPWYDVTFCVSGSYIRAHKWILAASSTVLAQLVNGGDTLIKVDGVDPDGFSQMIRFIYTGECELGDFGCKLLAIAKKYRIQSLFNKCEEYLMTVTNIFRCATRVSVLIE